MQVDINWLKYNFQLLNDRFFSANLPTPSLVVNRSNRYLGQCSCHFWPRTRIPNPSSYTIAISNFYQRNNGDFLNTLLHEMIHLYFYAKGQPDVGHGWEFQKMARSFDKYGFNVQTLSEVCTNLSPNLSTNFISHFIQTGPPPIHPTASLTFSVVSAVLGGRLSTFFHRSLWTFVLGMFLSNRDAMKVIALFSKIGAEEAWTKGCHLWTEYHMTEHLLELLNLLIQLSVILFDYIRQLVSNIL